MKVEHSYSTRPEVERHLGPPTEVVYYSTGETVAAGLYRCTFCGQTTSISHPRALATCSRCDNTEFSALARAA